MEKEISELKSVLRSLVVSSPIQVDVRTLMRDYRNMVGKPIPLSKYGYRDTVSFLKERFTDCFLFQGTESNPVLTLIVPDSLKHIDQFVQKQKISSSSKFKTKRRSIPEPIHRPNNNRNLIADTFPKKTVPSTKLPAQDDGKVFKPISNSDETSSIKNCESIEESCNSLNKMSLNDAKSIYVRENKSSINVQNFFKKRIQMSPSEYLENDGCSAKLSSVDDDSGRHTISSSSSSKQAKLDVLKSEIVALVEDKSEGVWCTDLFQLYRERYNRELNFSRFGYTSIVSLVVTFEDELVVSHSEATGDWLLSTELQQRPRARRLLPHLDLGPAPSVDVDDALPGIDFDPDVFPSDCMHFLDSIPSPDLSELEVGVMFELIVGEVYSPSHFWFIRLGEEYNIAMENMMDDMNAYYNSAEGNRKLSHGAVRAGHYCASLYDSDWHRSLIVAVLDSDTVKVRHVDYGTVERCAASTLRPLRREWGALPAQAARARLAAVRPAAAGRRWQRAAAAAFLAAVSDTRLYGRVTATLPAEDTIELFLIDTSGEEEVSISRELIRAGHADERGDSCLGTSESYLYPRFEALESGATPNYAEIYTYLRDGINLEYVDEFRNHVPSCLPVPPSPPCLPSPSMPPCLPSLPTPPCPHRSPTPPCLPCPPGFHMPAALSPATSSEISEAPTQVRRFSINSMNRISLRPDLIPRLDDSPTSVKQEIKESGQVEEQMSDDKFKNASCSAVPCPAPSVTDLPRPAFVTTPPAPRTTSAATSSLPHPLHTSTPMPYTPGFTPFPRPPMYSQFRPRPNFQPCFSAAPYQNLGMPNFYPQPPPSHYASQYPMPQFYTGNPVHYSHQNISAPYMCPPSRAMSSERYPAPPPASSPPSNKQYPQPRPIIIDQPPTNKGITLSMSEIEVFCLLSKVNAQAAKSYMDEAIKRAMSNTASSSTYTLNPEATEFRSVATETQTDETLVSIEDTESSKSPELTPAVRLFLERASTTEELLRPPTEFDNL